MLGGYLHICTCTCTIYCGLWPPDNTSCTFITWYQSPGLGLIFSDAQLVRNSGRRRPVPPVASRLRGALCSPPRSPRLLVCRRRFDRIRPARIGLQLSCIGRVDLRRPPRPRLDLPSEAPLGSACSWRQLHRPRGSPATTGRSPAPDLLGLPIGPARPPRPRSARPPVPGAPTRTCSDRLPDARNRSGQAGSCRIFA
jgi:hypothetical protein